MANSIHDLIKDRMNGRDSITLPKHSQEDATANSWVSKGVDDWNENSRKGVSLIDYAWDTMGDVMSKYDLFKRDPALALSWISSGKSTSNFTTGLTKGLNGIKQFTNGLDSINQTISSIQTGTSDKVNTLSSIINRNDMNTFGAAKKTFNEALNTLSTVGGMFNKAKKTKTTDKSSLMYWLELYAANPSEFAQLADTYIPIDKAPTEVKTPQDGFKYGTERAKYQLDKKYIARIPEHHEETVKEFRRSQVMSMNSRSGAPSTSDANAGIINNTLKFNPDNDLNQFPIEDQKELRRIKADYFEQSNPDIYRDKTSYNPYINTDQADYAGIPNTRTTQSDHSIKENDEVSFQNIIESLRADGYLSGYKDIAGFELGSNHQWKIEIYPYPYELDDVKRYETLKRNSCVPPLPCYILPNLWGKKTNKNTIQTRPTRDDVIRQSIEPAKKTSDISGAQELLKQASNIVNQAATGVADILSSVGINSKALNGIKAATSNEESNVNTNMLKFQQSGTAVALTDVGNKEVSSEYNIAKERDIPRDYRDKLYSPKQEDYNEGTMLAGVTKSILASQKVYNRNLTPKTEVESADESAPVIFSFSKNPPIMSYDLSIGNVNTESIPLFGGSSMTVFGGMTYSVILNIDMVDDVFGSMDKYMLHYINCVEDKYKNARAPYYNCAFYIKLKILEAGGHIKQSLNLIGVPITYTPRYDGQDQANEARISITFGIVGYKPPLTTDNEDSKRNATYKNEVGDIMWRFGNPTGKAIIMSKDRYTASNQPYNGQADLVGRRYGTLADLTWADIRLNIGNVSPLEWDKNTTFNAVAVEDKEVQIGDTITKTEEEVDTTTDKE